MEQPRVCQWPFRTACPCKPRHVVNFLDLPSSIRQRIYQYSGLFVDEEVWLPPDPWRSDLSDRYAFTANLLRVSKAVHDDVEASLYSRNRFFVWDYKFDEVLVLLSQLSPRACAQLQDLVVRLSFHPYGDTTWPIGFNGYTPTATDDDVIESWRNAAAHILAHAPPRRLRLRLACGTSDTQIIESVLAPLHQHPAKLRDLEIIFSRKHDPKLAALARDTVAQLAPKQAPLAAPFRFFDLPAEVRWHIYQYTELAMPLREVQWTPHRGFEVALTLCSCKNGSRCGETDTVHYCQERLCCPSNNARFPSCSKHQSAASNDCMHWKGPLPLMLVSRAMYQEAVAFFYSHNRVTILPKLRPVPCYGVGKPPIVYDPPQENALHLFVKRLSRPEVLRHLRHLEIIYPGLDPRTPEGFESSAMAFRKSWLQAVSDIAKYATIPSLKLTMHIYRSKVQPLYNEEGRPYPSADESAVFDVYSGILAPLKPLSDMGMGGFALHLEWPSNYHSPVLREELSKEKSERSQGWHIDPHRMPSVNWETVKMEEKLGKSIVGERYESQALKADSQLPSQTLRCLWDGRTAQTWPARLV